MVTTREVIEMVSKMDIKNECLKGEMFEEKYTDEEQDRYSYTFFNKIIKIVNKDNDDFDNIQFTGKDITIDSNNEIREINGKNSLSPNTKWGKWEIITKQQAKREIMLIKLGGV